MKRLFTFLAVLGPVASSVLATCDPPPPPATQPTPSCASLNVTIPDPNGAYDQTGAEYWWSCCNLNEGCFGGNYPRFHRYYLQYSDEDSGGQFTCYDTGHTYEDDSNYGCCAVDSQPPGD